jgi:hypothetical protein
MKTTTVVLGIVVVVAVGLFALGMVGTTSATATLNLYMTDPPRYDSDVKSINITFTRIELNQVVGDNESWITLSGNATTIDLLSIINSSTRLGSFLVPVGNYTQIRFSVSTATALIGNDTVTLTIPSGNETGLKVHFGQPLVLGSGASVNMTIDIRADNDGIHNGKLIPSMQATVTP